MMHIILMIIFFGENRSNVSTRHSNTWLTMVVLPLIHKPGTTKYLIRAPLSGLLRVLISFQDGYLTIHRLSVQLSCGAVAITLGNPKAAAHVAVRPSVLVTVKR